MFKETFEREYTWLNGFLRNVSRFKNRTAVFDPATGRKWTYPELNAECNKFANAMKADGVKKSDIVFNQLYNSPYFVFSYIAPQKLGAIANPANFNLSPGETAEIINHNKPKVYVYDSAITETAVKELKIAKHKPEVVIMADYLGKYDEAPEGHIKYAFPRRILRLTLSPTSTTRCLDSRLRVQRAHPRAFRSTTSTRCSPLTTLLCTSPSPPMTRQ